MNLRVFFFFSLTILFLSSGCKQVKKDEKQPNILFAIADDASWKHFGAYGCDWVKTPAFDRIAKEGILYTNAYTPNAKCAPSRSCIITGRNSWQLGQAANHNPYFPADIKSFVEVLGENGYYTGTIGKGWSPGNPGTVNGKRRELTGNFFNKYKTTPPTTSISDIDYARNFEAFLEQRPEGKPFFMWFGAKEPHRSYEFRSGINKGGKNTNQVDEVPDFWPDVDTIRADMLDYAFELEYFDKHLQQMLHKLDEIGELENTIIVVTADNGMPFPRIKGQVYEYSNHLPLAIRWDKGIQNPGRVVSDFVNFIDFAPTFLEAACIKHEESGMKAISGKSLFDTFKTSKEAKIAGNRDFVLVGKERHDVGRPNDEGYPVRGVFKGDYLYLRNFKPERWPKGNPETGYLNCDGGPTKTYLLDTRRKKGETKYWQLNFGKRIDEELYNIKEDSYCMNNLAGLDDFKLLKTELEQFMLNELRNQKDPRVLGDGDVFDNYEFAGKANNLYNRRAQGEKVPARWVLESDVDKDLLEH